VILTSSGRTEMANKGKQGGNTGSVEQSPRRKARRARARRREEAGWRAKAGEVVVRRVDVVEQVNPEQPQR
jgi:hypothetical protein